MVVVDGARRLINRTVDITVTSVHQTTAGKMIFGRLDERTEASAARTAPTHGIADVPSPRPVEHGSRHGEPQPQTGSERVPRPVVPDPSHEPE
jgi:hypothetical protein